MLLCLFTVPISTILALLIAVALNSIKPLQKVLQTIFFLPYVTNSIAIGMVFAAMFNIIGMPHMERLIQTKGIVNNVIELFGGHYVNWINQGSEYWANMFVMIVYIVWNALPFKFWYCWAVCRASTSSITTRQRWTLRPAGACSPKSPCRSSLR